MRVIRVLVYDGPEEAIRRTYEMGQRHQGLPWRGKHEFTPEFSITSTVDYATRKVMEAWTAEAAEDAGRVFGTVGGLALIDEAEREADK